LRNLVTELQVVTRWL